MDYYQKELVKALRNRGYTEEQIKAMSPQTRFEQYCWWKGLSDWGYTLWKTIDAAKDISPDAIAKVCEEPLP